MGHAVQLSCSNNLVWVRNSSLNFCLLRCCHRVTWKGGFAPNNFWVRCWKYNIAFRENNTHFNSQLPNKFSLEQLLKYLISCLSCFSPFPVSLVRGLCIAWLECGPGFPGSLLPLTLCKWQAAGTPRHHLALIGQLAFAVMQHTLRCRGWPQTLLWNSFLQHGVVPNYVECRSSHAQAFQQNFTVSVSLKVWSVKKTPVHDLEKQIGKCASSTDTACTE